MKCTDIYITNTNIFEDRGLQIDFFILMYVTYACTCTFTSPAKGY